MTRDQDISAPTEEPQETVVVLDVPAGQVADMRLDVYVTRKLPNATRSKVQQGIKEGRVTVNGDRVKVSYIVQPGDHISCVFMRPPPIEARPEPIPIDVVFEDDHLIVLNKAAGMVVHPAYGNRTGTLINALLHHTGSGAILADEPDTGLDDVNLSTVRALPRTESDVSIRPGLVHRLDKDTSGLMVIAKNDAVHADLAKQFFERSIDRRYRSIVWGYPNPLTGTIETNLGRDPRDRKRMAVVVAPAGKHAITNYESTARLNGASLVGFQLQTGRTHQIRVHAAYLGCPVFGDATYGGAQVLATGVSKTRKRFYQNLLDGLGRQALHAETLGFTHPISGERLKFESELPPDIKNVLDRLK